MAVPHKRQRHTSTRCAPTGHTAPMRILLATSPGVGHLLPLLPVARAAAARGHDVRIAAGSSLGSIVARAGFDHVPAGPASLGDVARAIKALEGLTGRRRAVVMVREAFAGTIARGIADDVLAAVAGATTAVGGPWRPDVIVHEDMELGSWIVAERLGIPHATIQVTAWRPRVRELMATASAPLSATYGLAPDAADRMLGRIFFSTRPASMLDPDAPLPEVTAELRPIADDRDGAAADAANTADPGSAESAAESAADPWPAGDGPRIAVTLGTVNAGQHDVLHAMVRGAATSADGTARVAVALGADPAAFGDVPSNVAVHRYVPMSALLANADAVVFHGGSGTFTAALATARPMVIVPLAADQLDNAERAVAVGIARSIAPDDLSADSVRAAIDDIRVDIDAASRLAAIAAEIAAMPGPEAAIERIEGIAGGR